MHLSRGSRFAGSVSEEKISSSRLISGCDELLELGVGNLVSGGVTSPLDIFEVSLTAFV